MEKGCMQRNWLRATGVDQVLDDLDQLETMMGRMPDGAPARSGSSSTLERPDG